MSLLRSCSLFGIGGLACCKALCVFIDTFMNSWRQYPDILYPGRFTVLITFCQMLRLFVVSNTACERIMNNEYHMRARCVGINIKFLLRFVTENMAQYAVVASPEPARVVPCHKNAL